MAFLSVSGGTSPLWAAFFNHDCTLPALGLEYDLWLPPGERLQNRLAKVTFYNEVELIRKIYIVS